MNSEAATSPSATSVDQALDSRWARVTLHSIGDAVIVVDLDAAVMFLNPVAEALTGWTAAEALGEPLDSVFRIVAEDTRVALESPVARVLREGDVVGPANHSLLIAKDGTERFIDDSAAPVRSEDGEIEGVVLVFRDVSERRQRVRHSRLAEEALLRSEQSLCLALQAGRMGTWEWNPISGEVSWSAGLETIHGLEPGTFGGTCEAFEAGIHPEDRERVRREISRSLEGGDEHCIEYRIGLPDGSTRWVEGRGTVFRKHDGEVARIAGVCVDVTDRKHAEVTLRDYSSRRGFLAAASKLLSSLVDYKSTLSAVAELAVPSFADWCTVQMVDDDGALERIALAHVDARRGAVVRKLLDDLDAATGLMEVLRTGQADFVPDITDDVLVEIARDDEHLRILRDLGLKSYLCVPMTVKGRAIGAMTFVRAESRRIFARRDLAVAEDLAHRGSIAVENARLYLEVRDADRRKDEFLAMLAHELRNPLAPLANGLELLALEGSASQETVRVMQKHLRHLVRLVDDLLDVSRIVWGHATLRKEPTELSAVIEQAVEVARAMAEDAARELIVSRPEEPKWVDADPVRLAQIMENLINNAFKYTNEGDRIELNAAEVDGQAVICVRDTGIGMEPDLVPRVFDLFTQSSRSPDRAQGGLGIGLTLVQRLVELHGGAVSARSEGLGEGSTFELRLPITAPPAAADEEPAASAAVREGRRILVVDDHVGAAEMLSTLLRHLGHQVEVAHDGHAALEKVKELTPEIVLLDIGLPGMDGYEVARNIREIADREDLLLVALTGYGSEEDRQKALDAGFDRHLVKPAELSDFQDILAQASTTGHRRF